MKTAAIAWRLSLAALLLSTTWQVWQLRRAPAWIQAQIEREAREKLHYAKPGEVIYALPPDPPPPNPPAGK